MKNHIIILTLVLAFSAELCIADDSGSAVAAPSATDTVGDRYRRHNTLL